MDEFDKSDACVWQVKAAKAAKAAMEERHEVVKKALQRFAASRSGNARYWMGIDDDTDQLYS